MKLSEITTLFEEFAPLNYQESYDNSGLLVGDLTDEVVGVLLCLDVTEAIVEEAVKLRANLIVSHHPLIFGSLKRLTGATATERIVREAIQHKIAIYACHTNLDAVAGGVSFKMGERLGMQQMSVLAPVKGDLLKLVTFVPQASSGVVRKAMFEAGAGAIGNYDQCSFNTQGEGTFRPGIGANPYVGEAGVTHFESEVKIETLVTRGAARGVVKAMCAAHPYEEVAYDLFALENRNPHVGSGVIGSLPQKIDVDAFFAQLKQVFNLKMIRATAPIQTEIQRVALCGGAGSFLIDEAKKQGADIFITGDLKYHDFFTADNQLILADIGHFESEQFTIEIFYDLLKKKNSNFAVHKSNCVTNPIIYI